MKKITNKIHLYLGLIIGLIIVIISLTGCIYAFQEELQNLTQSYRFVEAQETAFLPPSQLKKIAQEQLPGKTANRLRYGEKTQAAVLAFYGGQPTYYYLVYLNPYNGTVLKVKNMDSDFFRCILEGHFYLWLPPEIGQPTVATATLIFLVMVITGFILWWPKNKAAAKQRFRIKWDAKWRRKNYDLHNVMGFYASWILLFIAITGLVWGFQWFSSSLYWVTSGGQSKMDYPQVASDTTNMQFKKFNSPVDYIWQATVSGHPSAASIAIDFPSDHQSAIVVTTNTDAETHWKADNRFYDQYTLKEIPVKGAYGRYTNQLATADKLVRMNYDIHVGGILGLPGKFLAFFASLICASLPITGFMIWWGRRYKEKTKIKTTPAFINYQKLQGPALRTKMKSPQSNVFRNRKIKRVKEPIK